MRITTPLTLLAVLAAGCSSDSRPATELGGNSSMPGSGSNGGSSAGTGSASSMSASDAGSNGETCEEHVVNATLAAPDMLIVLDRSGSMNPNNNPSKTDRWKGSRDAVIQVTGQFQDRVSFGLMTFPAFQPGGIGGGQCTPGTLNVPIGINQGGTIATTLNGMNASGGTPTAPTLTQALMVLGEAAAPQPDKITPLKYVLLVTDGDPNCSDPTLQPNNQPDPLARKQTIDAIKALTAAGVKTYVVGFQTAGSSFATQLDAMAAAGGTGQTHHKSVSSGADLMATFSQIVSDVASCDYKLMMAVSDPTRVLVTVGGTPRKLDNADDGWTLGADMQTVTVVGAACDAVKSGAQLGVQVKCEVVQLQ